MKRIDKSANFALKDTNFALIVEIGKKVCIMYINFNIEILYTCDMGVGE